MARGVFHRRVARRSLLKSTALGAFAATAAGCGLVTRLGAKPRLSVWTDATFAAPADDYQTIAIEDWGRAKGVDVEVARETGVDVEKKLSTAIASKQVPDVAQMNDRRYVRFHSSGLLIDVSDLFAELGREWNGWYAPAQSLATRDGRQLLLPYSIDTALLLYRADILQAAGLRELPGTWSGLFDASRTLQKPPDNYGVGFQMNRAGTDAENTFSMMGYGYGASLVKPDGRTVNVKTPEMLAVMQEIKRSWELGIYPPGVAGWDNNANNAALRDGRALVIHNPASPLVWFRNNQPDMLPKIGVAATPTGPTGRGFNSAYVRDGFAILKRDTEKSVELSRDLLRGLYSRDVYRRWTQLSFAAPAVAGMEDHPVWQNPQRKAFLDAAKAGVLGGYPGEYTPACAELAARAPWLSAAIRMVVDKWAPEQAIDEMEGIAKDVYSKYNR